MLDFVHINDEEKEEIVDNQFVTAKKIIKEYVSDDVDDDEIELYEMIANDISEVIQDIDSDFLSERNRQSFVALVGYVDKNYNDNKDKLLKDWLIYFEKMKELMIDQIENFLHMKQDFDQFCRENVKSA